MFRRAAASIFIMGVLASPLYAAVDNSPSQQKVDQSPSKEKEEWTKNDVFNEFSTDYSHVGGATTTLGNGQAASVSEDDVSFSDLYARRYMRAFLVKTGLEWDSYVFGTPSAGFVPNHLYNLNMMTSVDFRWSRKDMIRIQARPGLYSDFDDMSFSNDVMCPLALAYTRVVSNQFQWFLALSYNPWRRDQLLPAGGFRWQINDKWKLKMFFPEPHIEYQAREDLHLFVGADFKGDTYRTGHDFGSVRGNPQLNNTLVDFQEIRVGPGFSWNIRPLIELNMEAGYMVEREFDYYNAGVTLYSDPAVYSRITLNVLFESPKMLLGPKTESGSFEIPGVKFPNISNVIPK